VCDYVCVTAAAIDADPTQRPYGVRVGDRVLFWPGNPPPLSEHYEEPSSLPALTLGFRSIVPEWTRGYPVWGADLAVVDPADGSLRILRDVPQVESFATANSRPDRSYGVPSSWHRPINPKEQP
jgi:hypothetical protein